MSLIVIKKNLLASIVLSYKRYSNIFIFSEEVMKTKNLAMAIATIITGVLTATTAQADPVASAESVVSFENFQIFRGGTATQVSRGDFDQFSVTASLLTAAAITGGAGAVSNPSSGNGTPLVATSTQGVLDPLVSAQLPNTATTSFKAFGLPFTGNFSASMSNDIGAPITNFPNSTSPVTANADLHNASYASLDTLNGSAGTSASSELSSTFSFSGYSGVLDFKFDIGGYVSAFLSAGAAQAASSSWLVNFTVVEQNCALGTACFVGFYSLGDSISDNFPGSGGTQVGGLNSSLDAFSKIVTSPGSFSTASLDAAKTYLLTANITTRAQVERIPEPEILALLGIGLLGMGLSSRRQKSSSVTYA